MKRRGQLKTSSLQYAGEEKILSCNFDSLEHEDILPESEQSFVLEFVKRLGLAWYPDYTKTTTFEAKIMQKSVAEIKRDETVRHNDINLD